MPIPDNASSVTYLIRAYNSDGDDPEILFEFTAPIHSNRPFAGVEDSAAQAAADAYRSTVQAAYPQVPVVASRTYGCDNPGDTWPPQSP